MKQIKRQYKDVYILLKQHFCWFAIFFSFLVCSNNIVGQTIAEGVYVLRLASAPSYVLDLDHAIAKNGSNILIWPYNGVINQQWKVSLQNGTVMFATMVNEAYVMDVYGGRAYNGCNIACFDKRGAANQRWFVEAKGDGFVLRSALDRNFVLSTTQLKPTNGQNVVLAKYSGGKNQIWKFERVSKQQSSQQPSQQTSQQPSQQTSQQLKSIQLIGRYEPEKKQDCATFIKQSGTYWTAQTCTDQTFFQIHSTYTLFGPIYMYGKFYFSDSSNSLEPSLSLQFFGLDSYNYSQIRKSTEKSPTFPIKIKFYDGEELTFTNSTISNKFQFKAKEMKEPIDIITIKMNLAFVTSNLYNLNSLTKEKRIAYACQKLKDWGGLHWTINDIELGSLDNTYTKMFDNLITAVGKKTGHSAYYTSTGIPGIVNKSHSRIKANRLEDLILQPLGMPASKLTDSSEEQLLTILKQDYSNWIYKYLDSTIEMRSENGLDYYFGNDQIWHFDYSFSLKNYRYCIYHNLSLKAAEQKWLELKKSLEKISSEPITVNNKESGYEVKWVYGKYQSYGVSIHLEGSNNKYYLKISVVRH